jgi:hypothetical protein
MLAGCAAKIISVHHKASDGFNLDRNCIIHPSPPGTFISRKNIFLSTGHIPASPAAGNFRKAIILSHFNKHLFFMPLQRTNFIAAQLHLP